MLCNATTDTFNYFEIIASVIVIANKVYGILLIPSLGLDLSNATLFALMMPVVVANVAFGALLVVHTAATLRDTMDVDTTDWSTAATDDVVVKLKALQREIDTAANAGHDGKAEEVQKEYNLVRAAALQDTRRTRGSRGRIFTAGTEASAELERELNAAEEAREALENKVPVKILQNTFSDRAHCIGQLRPGSSFLLSVLQFFDRLQGGKDVMAGKKRKRKKVASKKKKQKKSDKKEKKSSKKKRKRTKLKKIKNKLRKGTMTADDAMAAVIALNRGRKKTKKKKKKRKASKGEWPAPIDKELKISEKEWTRLSGLADKNFICPITMELMKEPAITTSTSMQYEKKAIIKWVKERGCDPLAPEHELKLEHVRPSVPLRNLIVKFVILERKESGGKKKKSSKKKKKSKRDRVSLGDVLAAGKGPKMKASKKKKKKKKKRD